MKLTVKKKALIPEQILTAIFLLYIEWYKEIWGDRPIVLYGIVALLTGCVIVRLICDGYLSVWKMPPLLKMYIVYFVYSLLGVFVAKDVNALISSVITYGCFTIVCFDCWYISSKQQDDSWIYRILKIVAVICAVQVIFFGKPYYNGIEVTTMGVNNNPNTLGLVLVMGTLSFTIDMKLEKKFTFFVAMAANIMMLYGIILTGSRKCLLVSIPIILYWLFFYVKTMLKERRYKKLIIAITVIVIVVYGCIAYVGRDFQNSAAFERMTQLFAEGGTDTRAGLYRDAFEYFKTSPIIGIGFNQYRQWSPHGYYSHSSYAEILSCGGLIGVLIFFVPLFKCLYTCILQSFKKYSPEQMYRMRMVALMLLCELFLGIGQIFVYDILHMLVLMLISMEASKQIYVSGRAEKALP